jgi:hypothetical protein
MVLFFVENDEHYTQLRPKETNFKNKKQTEISNPKNFDN